MADGMENAGKMPSWIYIVAGGGVLLLLLTNKGSKQSVATDNLLAAEIDATLKSMQERMEADNKQYREEQLQAWEAWKQSLENLLAMRYGVEPPFNWINTSDRYKKRNSGSEGIGVIPDVINAGMFDNYIMGFNFR